MTSRPNIVLAVVDSLRADHLGAYGYQRDTSPHIDRLSRFGVRFEQFFAHSNATHPSFTTMLTGRHPLNHGIVAHYGSRKLSPSVPVLPEALRDAGYVTAAVDTLRRWFERGFDIYQKFGYDHLATQVLRTGEEVNELAFPLITSLSRGKKPFFLLLHYWDPHSPYLPPPPHDRLFAATGTAGARHQDQHSAGLPLAEVYRSSPMAEYIARWAGDASTIGDLTARYDAEIAYVDDCIGRLAAHLTDCGLDSNTILVLTADHGESLGEHGIYFDHHGLYHQQLHIPLIVHAPHLIQAGVSVSGLARQMDLAPTLLDLAGAREGMAFEGGGLWPQVEGRGDAGSPFVMAVESTRQSKRAIRTEGWNLIQALRPDAYGRPDLELYDLICDPGEETDVAMQDKATAAALLDQLRAQAAREIALGGHRKEPMSDEGVSLLPPFALNSGRSLKKQVVMLLQMQGLLPREREGPATQEERELVDERLRDLGYL